MSPREHGCVVVSGASSGFGFRTALLLAEQGHTVVAVARREERLDALADAAPAGGRIIPLTADVRDRDELKSAFGKLPDDMPDITAVVNNAGLSRGFGPMQSADSRQWQEMIDTNVTGLLNVTSLLLPGLVERGCGHIVNIGSIAARYPYTGGNVYAATKAFVHQLSLNMRTDLEGTGVRVTCVAPGMARTEFALVRYDGDEQRADRLYDGVVPLTADDVAETVLWCLSRPPHVNVNMIEIMPTDQPFGLGFAQRRGRA
ncbi:SDR family NAD(P)-dependent oxidoreductase [Streptomyces sp. NBC_01210]|uniref:SDR family NAD(P)-dependent oxidoreductase n=1 Tax=Streptomyces sp. NBC_01210 TaxID=2903774 RepID=UPI002E0F8A88|nr:SDR family NAD(P)-dependent oxidoreductase [Streptomyces sp. NBC_01210]